VQRSTQACSATQASHGAARETRRAGGEQRKLCLRCCLQAPCLLSVESRSQLEGCSGRPQTGRAAEGSKLEKSAAALVSVIKGQWPSYNGHPTPLALCKAAETCVKAAGCSLSTDGAAATSIDSAGCTLAYRRWIETLPLLPSTTAFRRLPRPPHLLCIKTDTGGLHVMLCGALTRSSNWLTTR
jgi:hypothetical protein